MVDPAPEPGAVPEIIRNDTRELDSTAATNVTVVSDSTSNATNPPEAAGIVDVLVTTANGTSLASAADQHAPVRARCGAGRWSSGRSWCSGTTESDLFFPGS